MGAHHRRERLTTVPTLGVLRALALLASAALFVGACSSRTGERSADTPALDTTTPTAADPLAAAATVPAVSAAATAASSTAASSTAASSPALPSTPALRLVVAARAQVGLTTGYDPAYASISYPGGDVAASTGVCSDVVVRALRALDIDLQVRVHEDMRAHFSSYPTTWGLRAPDTNIDHRRVANLATYFERRGYAIALTDDAADYRPGDVVTFKIPLDHIGIVSDRSVDGRPLVIHNAGAGALEEDVLFRWKRIGHYRVLADS